MFTKYILKQCDKIQDSLNAFVSIRQDENANHLEKIKYKLENDIAKLYEIRSEKTNLGYIVFEIFKPEFVVLAAKSFHKIDFFRYIVPQIETLAKENGCSIVTCSTIRPGLIQESIKSGYQISEVVMRKYI